MNASQAKTGILGTLFALAGTFGLALGAQAGEVRSATAPKHDDVVVHFGDVNLDSRQGASVLYARLDSAAKRACGRAPDLRELKAWQDYKACHSATLDRAVGKLGHAGVQALHTVRKDGSRVG